MPSEWDLDNWDDRRQVMVGMVREVAKFVTNQVSQAGTDFHSGNRNETWSVGTFS